VTQWAVLVVVEADSAERARAAVTVDGEAHVGDVWRLAHVPEGAPRVDTLTALRQHPELSRFP
jgi:hypothetical protein